MESGLRGISQREFREQREQTQERLRESGERLKLVADDAEIVGETLGALEGNETQEAWDVMEGSIDAAGEVTEAEFDRETGELEQIQGEGEEYQSDMEERSQSTESDLEKIGDATGRMQTEGAVNEMIGAKDAALRDKDFFQEEFDQSQETVADSKRVWEEEQQRMQTARRSKS